MREDFLNPEGIYRGTDLWMLNDRLDEDELRRQIREFKDKGFYSFIARTYDGIKSDYPGEDFMHKLEVIVDEARRCGMEVALQAGYMPGAFPDLPPRYALKYIAPVKRAEGGEAPERLLCSHGGTDFVETDSEFAVDMFNAEAVSYYIGVAYEQMWKRFEGEYGKTIFSVWLDEPRYDPKRTPYTSNMPELFRRKWGYELLPNIYKLYIDEGDYKALRYHYHTLMQELMAECYFTQISAWCTSHKLLFSGHLMAEDTLKQQVSTACAVMPYYKYFDIPGIDKLTIDMNWAKEPITASPQYDYARYSYYTTPIQCVSAAHQAGKRHILCEMYGVTAPNLTFRSQKQLFDHFAAMGVNHRCVHALFYSAAGFRKRFYPQHVNYYQPYWKDLRTVNDYVARVSRFISYGDPVGETLVLHPLETAYGMYRGLLDKNDDNGILDEYDAKFFRLVMALFSAGKRFEFADLLTAGVDGKVENDRLRVGAMTYDTLVLPDLDVISSGILRLLRDYSAAGGKIIALGKLPDRLDGVYSDDLVRELSALPGVVVVPDRASLVRELDKRDAGYSLESGDDISGVIINRRYDGKSFYYYIYSRDCSEAKNVALKLSGSYDIRLWDASDGSIERTGAFLENGVTSVPLRIEAGGSLLLSAEPGVPVQPKVPGVERVLSLGEGWELERKEKNLMTLEYCRYKKDNGEYSGELTAARVIDLLKKEAYAGPLTVKFEFASDFAAKNLSLVIEEPECQEILFNGVRADNTAVGYHFDKSFKIIRLPDVCRAGDNVIELTRDFTPAISEKTHLFQLFRAPKGVDIEPIHLYGDFAVSAMPEFTPTGYRRYDRHFLLTEEKKDVRIGSDVTCAGYPFYVGELILRKTFTLGSAAELRDAVLKAGMLYACRAGVTVNGVDCGGFAWEPYEAKIGHALRDGENTVELRLTGTLRNMMGPYHTASGEVFNGSIYRWVGSPSEFGAVDYDLAGWVSSSMIAAYGIRDVVLKY